MEPERSLSTVRATAIIVGIVVGVGIFRAPALVAANSGSELAFMLLWLAGGAISLVGALCYAELSAAHANVGGEYHFLRRAFGDATGFLFAWCRLAIIQTGAIAAVAFVFGDYAAGLLPLGPFGPALYAALAIICFTAVNAVGRGHSTAAQLALTGGIVAALAAVVVVGLVHEPLAVPQSAAAGSQGTTVAGAAMIFVLLTYGGWNEAAYLSAEVRDAQRNMVRILTASIGLITLLYLAINLAYLNVLGLDGIRKADIVAADLMTQSIGPAGAIGVSLLIAAATLSTLNATIFTGARTSFAMGRDHALLRPLGVWDARSQVPLRALLAQGGLALGLVLVGSVSRDGFATMVEFTAPAFWLFFLLTGLSLFLSRRQEPATPRPFRVPLYPITPMLFCLTSAYMLYASIAYTGLGALLSVAVILAGIPLFLLSRSKTSPAQGAGDAKPEARPY